MSGQDRVSQREPLKHTPAAREGVAVVLAGLPCYDVLIYFYGFVYFFLIFLILLIFLERLRMVRHIHPPL